MPVTVERDVAYGTAGGQRLLLDAYVPADGRSGRGAVVMVHGGAWAIGDKSSWLSEGRALAEGGIVGIAVNYRLGPAGVFPAAADDVRTAIVWVQDHASHYGIDPARIGLFGASAGGQLVMLVGTTRPTSTGRPGNGGSPGAPGLGVPGAPGPGRPPVVAVASWSGPTNMTTLGQAAGGQVAGGLRPPEGCGTNNRCVAFNWPPAVVGHLGCTVAQCLERYRQASPVDQVTTQAPSMYIVNSRSEVVPAAQATEMADRLRASGVTVTVVLRKGNLHADAYKKSQTGPTVRFFERSLTRAPRS